jgi:hypothetical protein
MIADNPVVAAVCNTKSVTIFFKNNGVAATPKNVNDILNGINSLRFYYDFEFWAIMLIVIKEFGSSNDIKFLLNHGQRRILGEIYKCINKGLPIRIIILKCRRLGSSTFVNILICWLQLVRKKQWNSVICAHVENTAKSIRGMTAKILKSYPPAVLGLKKTLKLQPYEGSGKIKYLACRDTRITVGSSEKPENVRGGDDIALALLSEVGLWKRGELTKPEDLAQSIISGIPQIAETMIIYESTAKGVGNFFHREYLRAKAGESGYVPIFIAWFEIEYYQTPVDNYMEFINSMTEREKWIFTLGATLESIQWYRNKRKEYSDEWRFISEFPCTDVEAFQSTGRRYYSIESVQRLRLSIKPPNFTGDITGNAQYGADALNNLRFTGSSQGNLKIWSMPGKELMQGDRYVVVVDINKGLSSGADNGIICVLDRYWQHLNGVPEVAAEYCGKLLIRYLIWKAVQLCVIYHNALLVVESNTQHNEGNSDMMLNAVFDEINLFYNNIYCDTPAEQIKQGIPPKWGFRTTHSSKITVCSHQQAVLENDKYIEYCKEAVDEHDTFEVKENGTLGAVDGCRDDRHITRAIGIWVCYNRPAPSLIIKTQKPEISHRKSTGNNNSTDGMAVF